MPAYYEVVDGLEVPAKLGGHPALDFCNTLAGWDGNEPRDYLSSYDHLAVWAAFAELLPGERVARLRREARRRPEPADHALRHARAFRQRLYGVLRDGAQTDAFDPLSEDVAAAASRARLRRSGERVEWEISADAGLAAPVDAVAWSAGQLVSSAEFALVRACPGGGCGWLFLDRRGRRRWCTMATCGNRAKAKRFASRHGRASAAGDEAR